MGGDVNIWIKPVMLPDTYPDDVDEDQEDEDDAGGT